MENDTIKGGGPYRFFTIRSELERCLGGIQSAAKNLSLFLYLERLLLRIASWANCFCRFKGVEKVFIHPNGWNYFRFVGGGRIRFAPTKIVTFPRHPVIVWWANHFNWLWLVPRPLGGKVTQKGFYLNTDFNIDLILILFSKLPICLKLYPNWTWGILHLQKNKGQENTKETQKNPSIISEKI